MNPSLNRVAILGAGTMGAQIAAHFANVDIRTLLLDLPSEGADAGAIARRAVEALARRDPPPLFSPEKARFIEAGNFRDHLPVLSSCDWIIEAVVEKLEIKQGLWKEVESHRSPGTIVSTNTSGLPVAQIANGRSEDFQKHWLGTHFFNPPRYMKLLELIPGPKTLPQVVETVAYVGDRLLGKGIVAAKDTPNFIANRIGAFAAMRAIELMQEQDLTVEAVDALTGPPIGRPKTGTFRLADLVGVDILLDVGENLYANLSGDSWRESFRPRPFLKEMVARGLKGMKAGQGFYKKTDSGEILTLDLKTLEYRPQQKVNIPSLEMVRSEPDPVERVRQLLAANDRASAFLWPFLRDTFVYAAQRVPEIADEYYQIDRAMKWGFNWELGPFELWQELGAGEVVRRAREDGLNPPEWIDDFLQKTRKSFYVLGPNQELFFDLSTRQYQVLPEEKEKIRVTILKQREAVIRSNPGATLLDLGDGVACLEFHSKMNAIGGDIVEMAQHAVQEVEKNFLALVIGNQGRDFSVGANLMLLLLEAQEENWDEIDAMIRAFQNMNMAFRYSAQPVVAAPFQRVLGGGAEICLACNSVVAGAETYIGLVEVGVGLIPAGGGTKEMLVRHIEELRSLHTANLFGGVKEAFQTIGMAKVSRSAEDARRFRYLRKGDLIEIHPDRLLFHAKKKALTLVEEGYIPPQPDQSIPVLGEPGFAALKMLIHLMRQGGYITDYDVDIGRKLAYVLTGGDINHPTNVSEQYLLDLEREAFLSLCGDQRTQERIQHMLRTGKPLRN